MTTVALLLTAALAACTPSPAPVSQSPHEPSNPAAAEGVMPSASVAAAIGKDNGAAPAAAHAGHDHGSMAAPSSSSASPSSPAGVVYTCPMHPEVTSAAPGTCPKCNMNLVPKK